MVKQRACVTLICTTSIVMGLATNAWAGDVESGRRLARDRCAPCHVVGPGQRDELAAAPPFTVIAQKFPSAALITALRGPYRKMNFRPTEKEADDIAEYIRSLAR